MRRSLVWLLVIGTVGILTASLPAPGPEETLLQTWEAAHVQTEQFMIHHGGRSDRFMLQEEVPRLAQRLAQAWNLELSEPVVFADGTRWTAKSTWGRNIHVQCIVINDRPQQSFTQPYISIQVTGRGHPERHQLSEARSRIIHTLKQHQIQPRTHFSLQGRISSSDSDRERVVGSVLQRLGAHEVESMKSEHTTSVSAYTPLFAGGLSTNGKTMNIQVAAKDADRGDGVILTVGTPIITIEY